MDLATTGENIYGLCSTFGPQPAKLQGRCREALESDQLSRCHYRGSSSDHQILPILYARTFGVENHSYLEDFIHHAQLCQIVLQTVEVDGSS